MEGYVGPVRTNAVLQDKVLSSKGDVVQIRVSIRWSLKRHEGHLLGVEFNGTVEVYVYEQSPGQVRRTYLNRPKGSRRQR